MFHSIQRQLSETFDLLPTYTRPTTNNTNTSTSYSPVENIGSKLGHRRQISLSSPNPRKVTWIVITSLFAFVCFLAATAKYTSPLIGWHGTSPYDDDLYIPLGKSVDRGGREVFWWEQFPRLFGFYRGRNDVVPPSVYVPEQQQPDQPFKPLPSEPVSLKLAYTQQPDGVIQCSFIPPSIQAYDGLPQGMPSALLGSVQEMGINDKMCYDRIARYGHYGFTTSSADGGLGLVMRGDSGTTEVFDTHKFRNVKWVSVQDECVQKNQALVHRPRTAFILRTWHTFEYTPHHILMLRAMINELSLRTGGQIYVHFLIHVQDDSLPIFASREAYDATLKSSLPEEFEGMGTLWSVPQMKLIYPPPFPESIINFSGGDVYQAYRSLHFPMQYFASQHPEFDYFWQWEMDIRVTGHYGELIEKIAEWADKQSRDHLWERSSKFFIPSLHDNSFTSFAESVVEETKASKIPPVSGPMLPKDHLLPIPSQPAPSKDQDITDLITLSPLFNPEHTRWAFHDDITGYPDLERPPTRAALIAASRMSRRLLLLMHQETYAHKHTMFPEMYPASIALHYGLKAVYAPITTYFDRNWPSEHADEIFNNGKLRPESYTAGMDHGGGHFHAENGSVFGPGEHVFRGASWYSNAGFAGYLWRRWLGEERNNGEIDWELGEGRGRMCLPMMVLHPVKNDA